jgi:formate C-acetyltransferase
MRHKLPRYGNDDAAADRYATMVSGVFSDVITARHNTRGGSYIAGFYTMTCHHAFGRRTGALPDGRRAGERLSNGLAPIDGADRHGPTALLNSAARLDSSALANGYALNVKFDPAAVAGERGEQLLSSLVRGFVDSGGMQVQINVVDAATLRAAQADPAAHPGLVVRVAGYCAYFADLRPEVQDEIIARTAHG